MVNKREWDGEYYEDGDEVAKRDEHFGEPVGKSPLSLLPSSALQQSTSILHSRADQQHEIFLLGEEGVPPVLICKIRKGQALKVRCIAKKVSYLIHPYIPYPYQRSSLTASTVSPGPSKRALEMVSLLGCGV